MHASEDDFVLPEPSGAHSSLDRLTIAAWENRTHASAELVALERAARLAEGREPERVERFLREYHPASA